MSTFGNRRRTDCLSRKKILIKPPKVKKGPKGSNDEEKRKSQFLDRPTIGDR